MGVVSKVSHRIENNKERNDRNKEEHYKARKIK